MCTVSWAARPGGGYDLWFNRDESRFRSRGLPPRVWEGGFLAPVDPDGGGTWIATDTGGTTTSVLNYYDASPPAPVPHPLSRGQLVVDIASGKTAASALDPARYRPFHLLQVMPDGRAELLTWDGHALATPIPPLPLSTSSFRTAEVLAFRRDAFAAAGSPSEFHWLHDPEHPAHSPLMARPDARTVSVTHVAVSPRDICYRYAEPSGTPPAPSRPVCAAIPRLPERAE